MNKLRKSYIKLCNEIAEAFAERYFVQGDGDDSYTEEWYWAGGEPGDVFCISDYFFQLEDMVRFIDSELTFYQLDKFYWQWLEEDKGQRRINARNWIKLFESKKK